MQHFLRLLISVVTISFVAQFTVLGNTGYEVNIIPSQKPYHMFSSIANPELVPILKFEVSPNDIKSGSSFTLFLQNSSWSFNTKSAGKAWDEQIGTYSVNLFNPSTDKSSLVVPNDGVDYRLVVTNANTATLTINKTANITGKYVYIPLVTKLGVSGSAFVNVHHNANNNFKISNIKFAEVTAEGTVTSVSSNVTFNQDAKLGTIIINEQSPGTFNSKSGDKIRLTAPEGFYFKNFEDKDLLSNINLTTENWDQGLKTPIIKQISAPYDSNILNNSVIDIYIFPFDFTRKNKGSIKINNLVLAPRNKASEKGDVYINVKGIGITESDVLVGRHESSNLSFYADEKTLPELVTGYYPEDPKSSDIKALTANFNVYDSRSWNFTSPTEFLFPKGVKPRAVKISTKNLGVEIIKDKLLINDGKTSVAGDTSTGIWKLEDKGLTLSELKLNPSNPVEINLTFYLSIDPEFSGDVTLTAKTAAPYPSTNTVIAKAVSPVTISAKSVEMPLGINTSVAGDIIIQENVPGALKSSLNNDSLIFFIPGVSVKQNSAKVTVTKGDITLGIVRYPSQKTIGEGTSDKLSIAIPIRKESTKPSTIRISGLQLSPTKETKDGFYELNVKGVISSNYSDSENTSNGLFSKKTINVLEDYIIYMVTFNLENFVETDIETPAYTGNVVSVQVGSPKININGLPVTMDATPFIENGYTMVPLSHISIALGLSTDKVVWDSKARTVTITYNDNVSVLTIGSKIIVVNDEEIEIPISPMVRNGRTYLPFRVLGEHVLNVPISWDSKTKTASFGK